MSIFVRVKRSVVATGLTLALIAGVVTSTVTAAAEPSQAAAGDTSLGAVTGFAADGSQYTLTAGTAKVRVVFVKDDVFRIWLAPDGTFTDPANTPPSDPTAFGLEHRHQDRLPQARDVMEGQGRLLLAHHRRDRSTGEQVAAALLALPRERPAGLVRDRAAVLEQHLREPVAEPRRD